MSGFLRAVMVGMLACPAMALAFDLSPDTARHLGDPAYLTEAGHVSAHTSLAYTTESADRIFGNGMVSPHVETTSRRVTQGFSIGVSDRLSLSANVGYEDERDHNTTPFGTASFRSQGLLNPQVGFTYRAVEQLASPVNVDILAGYAPDAFPAKDASRTRKGTVARGGEYWETGLALSRVMSSLTLQARAGVERIGKRERQDLFDDSTTTLSSSWIYGLGIHTQTRFDDHWYLNVGADYWRQTGLDVSNPSQNVAYSASFDPSARFFIAPGYHVVPNRVVVSAEYGHTRHGTENMSTPAGVPAWWRNHDEDRYALTVRYLLY